MVTWDKSGTQARGARSQAEQRLGQQAGATEETAPQTAPATSPQTLEQTERQPQQESGFERKRPLLLRMLDRFGTNAPKSEEQRQADVAYRTAREAAFDAAFPALANSPASFDQVLKQAHAILNQDKKFSTIVRLSTLILGNNLKEGQYRTGPNRAGDYLAPAARDVERLMKSFGTAMGRLLPLRNDDDAMLVAGWALTVMIRTHPFMDGNGRTARAAINLVLEKSGQRTIDFPADSEGIYKKSPVWARLKDHMRGFVGELGWSMKDGAVPPHGYHDKVASLLDAEIAGVTVEGLRQRQDIAAIAAALQHARAHGFQ